MFARIIPICFLVVRIPTMKYWEDRWRCWNQTICGFSSSQQGLTLGSKIIIKLCWRQVGSPWTLIPVLLVTFLYTAALIKCPNDTAAFFFVCFVLQSASCHKMASNLKSVWFLWFTECRSLCVHCAMCFRLQVRPADGTKLTSNSALGAGKADMSVESFSLLKWQKASLGSTV